MSLELVPIGRVESSLTDKASAPKQGNEGAPEAWLVFERDVLEGLGDRPNPIGLYPVEVLSIEGNRFRVSEPEALDGTPIVDITPVLDRRTP